MKLQIDTCICKAKDDVQSIIKQIESNKYSVLTILP